MTSMEQTEVPSCKDFISQLGPIDMLLGSLSYEDTDNVEGKTQQIRTSARVFKKMKFDQSINNTPPEKKEEEKKPEVDVKQERKPPVNPLWTSEEKTLFFEALNEYGKDFESIHLSVSMRLKKRGTPEDAIKTKHQVRSFYYKTFHMLFTALKFSDKVPKNAQELYALINYGEMRRKIGSVHKKNLNKLQELVYNGSIILRVKGKTIRVKTPMCRALRRLNQLDEKYDDLKLPSRVLVELKPRDMVSFLRVQSVAQNPRIKVGLSLQKRVSSLIDCLNARWKSTSAVIYDKALISSNVATKDCVPDKKSIEENNVLLIPLLRLCPPLDAKIELPIIDISEYFTGQSICLTAYEIRKGVNCKVEEIKKEDSDFPSTSSDPPVSKPINIETVASLLSQQSQEAQSKTDNKVSIKIHNEEEDRAKIQEIRQGWTLENCGCLTVGEIYLMYGADSKLLLEYSWDQPIKTEEETLKPENQLTNSLKKLLALAKLQADPPKPTNKCTCGHICGSKSNATFKKPMSTKPLKKSQSHEHEDLERTKQEEHRKKEEDISNSVAHLYSQLDMMHRMNPNCSRNKGRPICKQLVVERKLVPLETENKHHIVSMNIVPQENDASRDDSYENNNDMDVEEPPKFSSFLENNNAANSAISILDKDPNEWITTDVNDYSLSSLLGQLNCPSKTASIAGDDSQLAQDVSIDSHLRTLLSETSIDYAAKFADLAAQVEEHKK